LEGINGLAATQRALRTDLEWAGTPETARHWGGGEGTRRVCKMEVMEFTM